MQPQLAVLKQMLTVFTVCHLVTWW